MADQVLLSISEILNNYIDDIKNDAVDILDKTAINIVEYIKSNAPRSGNKDSLADSFVIKEFGKGIDKQLVIYSKTKGPIVHLVELGYRHRSGKYVSARPFLRPAYDELSPKMIEDIKKIIEEGNIKK